VIAMEEQTPGPLADEKTEPTSEPGAPEPSAAEVESARILGNEARAELHAAGLSDGEIDALANRYIAEDLGEDVGAFVAWAKQNRGLAQAS
jgi:hypothetical protein